MTRGAEGRLARWILLGLGLVLVSGLIAAAAVERKPSAGSSPVAASPGATTPTRTSGPGATPTLPPTAPSPSKATAAAARYVFPVVGKHSYGHTHHDYPATDIIAACGLTVRAATGGVVLEVTRIDVWNANTNNGADRGGLSVSWLGDDGLRYYGSHMRAINRGIEPGVRVRAGDSLGQVGETGDASVCHLHFGISPPCAMVGDWWVRRGVVWPWPYLDSWAKGGQLSAVKEVTAWQKKNGCPGSPTVDP